MNSTRLLAALILVSLAVGSDVALSQEPAWDPSFEVVSIRQATPKGETYGGEPEYGVTPNGWRLNDGPLFIAIINAYTPQANGTAFYTPKQMQGLPTWVFDERY